MTVLQYVRRATIIIIVVSGMPLGLASAQPSRLRDTDSVPRDLVTALIRGAVPGFNGGAGPQVTVGSIPAPFAAELFVPSDAHVLGAVASSGGLLAFLSTADSPDHLYQILERELGSLGWKAPPVPEVSGGGFRSVDVPQNTALGSLILCRGSELLTVSVSASRAEPANVMMRLSSSGSNTCHPQPRLTPTPNVPRLPTLFNPADASPNMQANCFRGSGGSNSTNTTLATSLAREALLDYYGRQLQDSGWVATSPTPTIIGRTWTRPDSTGALVEVSITVRPAGQNGRCSELNMQLTTPRAR